MSTSPSRMLHVDALKALAAQVIVLHHLAAYGPVGEALDAVVPWAMDALYHHGRMAVQVFLVVGGFLSARGLAPRREPLTGSLGDLAGRLGRRHLRLSVPFFAAVLITLACSAAVARWVPELVPEQVAFVQLLSHALLLHGVLGHEALTVGAWYVAIDLQLFALLLVLLRAAGRMPRVQAAAPALVLLAVTASLWVFNRDADLDDWAPYFFGAYGLGVLVHWLSQSRWRVRWLALMVAGVAAALAVDFRGRVALALATAVVLALLHWRHERGRALLPSGRVAAVVGHLGTHSYALFLVHFPVCLLVNAAFQRADPAGAGAAFTAAASAWALSNLAAVAFHRWVEAPAGRWPRPARLRNA